MDPKIREAIEAAVDEAGQDASLSRKLVAWFEELSSGNEEIEDAERHLKLLYDSTLPRTKEEAERAKYVDDLAPDVGGEPPDSDGSPDR